MAYTNKAELVAVHGTPMMAALSNQTPKASTTDDARITLACAWADDYINTRLRGTRYVVPFSTLPALVGDIAKKLSVWWLYNTRLRKKTDAIYKFIGSYKQEADDLLAMIVGGEITLEAELDSENKNTPFVVG